MFFHFWLTMNASPYHQRDIILCLCWFKTNLRWYSFLLMFLFSFYPWPYILNVWTCSRNAVDVLSIIAHEFRNLFWKICSPFGQILITSLRYSRASFSSSSYRKKMRRIEFVVYCQTYLSTKSLSYCAPSIAPVTIAWLW